MGSDIQTSWLQKLYSETLFQTAKKLLKGGGFSRVPREGAHPFYLSQVW